MVGQEINYELTPNSNPKFLGKLAAGMYMVSLSSDTEAPIVQKLVKQD